MYLACLLIIFTIGDVGSSVKELISNGKKYYILDHIQPEDSECKGSESLMDADGNIFCFKKDTDEDNSQQFQWNYGECGRENKDEARIMGGDKAKPPNRFPWVVIVGAFCTGSIISSRAILTAGHCVAGYDKLDIYASSGFYYWNKSLKYHTNKVIVHPKYNQSAENSGDDIAILITDREIEYSKSVGPICLPKIGMNMEPGTEAIGIGYGAIASMADILIKYRIIKTPLPTIEPSLTVLQYQKFAYDAFKDIMPYIDEVFFSNLTLKNKDLKNDKKGIEKLIKQHQYDKEQIAKTITDKQDLDHFNKMYYELIFGIIVSSYDTDDGLKNMFFRINMNMMYTKADAPKYVKETFAEEKECPASDLSEGLVCVRSSMDGGICVGDSGGPLAAHIGQKYYIGGVTSSTLLKKSTFPFQCRCHCPEDGPNHALYTSVNYFMDWIMKQLVENNAQIQ